jgi:short-subunit dehydrogenase
MSSTRKPLVFITGASSGIGQALALRFYEAGYALALVARRTEEVQSWAGRKKIATDLYEVYSADVSRVDSIISAASECVRKQGLPDVVIANAGISIGMDSGIRSDLDVMAQTFATNNIGMAATFHPFIDAMVKRKTGKFVGIASVAGIRGLPGHGAYCSSKAAVVSYCESLRGDMRAETGKNGVQVITIAPGYVATPLTESNKYSMPFLLQPEEFAERAFAAIEQGVSYRVIPWQMGLVAKILRLLPDWLFDRLFAGRPRKKRREAST